MSAPSERQVPPPPRSPGGPARAPFNPAAGRSAGASGRRRVGRRPVRLAHGLLLAVLIVSCPAAPPAPEILPVVLDYPEPACEVIEARLNEDLANLLARVNTTIRVKSGSGPRGVAETNLLVRNNTRAIVESGYGLFSEAYGQQYEVVLHVCYYESDDQMFYIHGRILANGPIDLRRLQGVRLFAVSSTSSSGWRLQRRYLEDQGIVLPSPEFLGTPQAVIAATASTVNSIGFAGSFVDRNELDILYESPAVPGAVVFAHTRLDPELRIAVAQKLKDYSIEEALREAGAKRFYVYPLRDDYVKYLDLYERAAGWPWWEVGLVVLLLVGLAVTLWKLRKANRKIKRMQTVRDNGFADDFSFLEQRLGKDSPYFQSLEKAIDDFPDSGGSAPRKYNDSIFHATQRLEGLVKLLCDRFLAFGGKDGTSSLSTRGLKEQTDFLSNTVLEKGQACLRDKNRLAQLSGAERQVLEVLPALGVLRHLHTMRNISHHDETDTRRTLYYSQPHAAMTIRTYGYLLRQLIELKRVDPDFPLDLPGPPAGVTDHPQTR